MKREKIEGNNNKVYIIIIILLVLFGIMLASVLMKEKNDSENKIDIEKSSTRNVADYISFFSIQNIINKFIFSNNAEEVYSMLDEEYINEEGITQDNVIELAKKGLIGMNYKCQKVQENKANNRFKDVYITNGIIIENGLEDINIIDTDFKAIVLLDYDNLTFSIIPNTDNLKEALKNKKKVLIEKNKYNVLPSTGVKDYYDICLTYYNDFVFKINYLPDEAYNLLDSDSKEKVSKTDLYNLYGFTSLNSCKYDSEGATYIATATNEKIIQFKEKSIMDYSVYLE